jgi:hypothetical protein
VEAGAFFVGGAVRRDVVGANTYAHPRCKAKTSEKGRSMRRAGEWGNRPLMFAGAIKFSIMLAGVAFASSAQAACDRDMLQKLAETYVQAQSTGNPSMLPLAQGASYAENDEAKNIGTSVLASSLKIDFTRSLHDTTQCATFTELVAATNPHPYVIHTRIEATADGKVSKMESVVTDEGDWVFGAAEHLAVTRTENWGEIPQNQRDTRAVIQAAADAYLDNWGDPDLPVPHGTPCARLEGRVNTGSKNPEGNSCDMGAFPEKLNVGSRRYLVDESRGAVVVFHKFPWLDAGLPKDPGIPASQMFRVEGGKNRYIHEVTVCITPNCGRKT